MTCVVDGCLDPRESFHGQVLIPGTCGDSSRTLCLPLFKVAVIP